MSPRYQDRRAAGRALAAALEPWRSAKPVVIALPRGGVPVGYEVALALHAPLDVAIVRKIGMPGHEELGIGALVDSERPMIVMNDELVRRYRPDPEAVAAIIASEQQEARRRQERYSAGRKAIPLAGRTVILVDDGIATGGTARAALRGLRSSGAAQLVLAVPVAPQDSLDMLAAECDAIVCPYVPTWFGSVGEHYRDFRQVEDDEVVALLGER